MKQTSNFKRLAAVLLTLCMTLELMPTAAFAAETTVIDAKNFPDDTFRTYVTQFDSNSDGVLSWEEITQVISINVRDMGIDTLKGIEYFENLASLYCDGNNLSTLDISSNLTLTDLSCTSNSLSNLDVSRNSALKYLFCGENYLSRLDVSKNAALLALGCNHNRLTTLDVSSNHLLRELWCNSNNLTALDVSSNPDLEYYSFLNNIYTITLDDERTFDLNTLPDGFDVNRASSWTDGYVVSENILSVPRYAAKVTYDYDCGNGKSEIFTLNTFGAPIAINDSNFPDESFRAYVKTFDWNSDGFLSGAEIMQTDIIDVRDMNISTLKGIEYFENLDTLICDNNVLTGLDISKNRFLQYLSCNSNKLTTLDVSNNPALYLLQCDDNFLTQLDISNNFYLESLTCVGNQLSALDVSNNMNLTSLCCSDNELTTLDITSNSVLNTLFCWENKLTALDVTSNPALEWLDFSYNCLTTIDVSGNPLLTWLGCHHNNLTSLNVSNNPALKDYYFFYNCYDVSLGSDRTFDLGTLPVGFDVSKASGWTGGSVSGNILTVDKNAAEITYVYDCGGGKTTTFTLHVTTPAESDLTVTLTSDKFEVGVGKLMNFTTSASGGAGNYTYEYVIRYSGKEEHIHATKTSSICRYKMAKPGTKEIAVTVTDDNGNKATGSCTVTVK